MVRTPDVKCETCDITLNSPAQARQHFAGKNHLRRLNPKAGKRSRGKNRDKDREEKGGSKRKASDGNVEGDKKKIKTNSEGGDRFSNEFSGSDDITGDENGPGSCSDSGVGSTASPVLSEPTHDNDTLTPVNNFLGGESRGYMDTTHLTGPPSSLPHHQNIQQKYRIN